MVEIGELSIGGNIQTNQIESGLNRIEDGFKDVEKSSKSVNSDFERLNQGALKLSKRMGVLAIAGGGAMVAIAKGAPATAGAMAKIKVAGGELQRSLGRALAPAFEKVSEGFNKFVGWVEKNEGTIKKFSNEVLDDMSDILAGITESWSWIANNVDDISAKVGIDFDLTGSIVDEWGVAGALGLLTKVFTKGKVGAGPAAMGVKTAIEVGELAQGKQGAGETVGSIGGTWGGAWAGAKLGGMGGAAIGSIFPGAGTAIGAGIGTVGGGIAGAIGGEALLSKIGQMIDLKLSGTDKQDMEYAQ